MKTIVVCKVGTKGLNPETKKYVFKDFVQEFKKAHPDVNWLFIDNFNSEDTKFETIEIKSQCPCEGNR